MRSGARVLLAATPIVFGAAMPIIVTGPELATMLPGLAAAMRACA